LDLKATVGFRAKEGFRIRASYLAMEVKQSGGLHNKCVVKQDEFFTYVYNPGQVTSVLSTITSTC